MTEAIEAKIEKLLRVADGTANEHESALALQMAQKLADTYNLDLGVIGHSGARKDEKVSKGLYKYQRTLYAGLADLNHCKVWISKGLARGSKYTIRLLGSKVNVTVTKTMADYLEEVTNRMVRERYDSNRYFSADAHLFREGMIDRMVERVRDKRQTEERERQRAKREQEMRTRHPGAATENAVVLISDVAREEERANYDYLNGEGAWDKRESSIQAVRERRRQALAEYEAWAAANPEEVARREAEAKRQSEAADRRYERLERQREQRRQERINQYGYDPQDYRRKATKYDSREYYAGRDEGDRVNLDDQIDQQQRKGIA